jgi:hypothetical protein
VFEEQLRQLEDAVLALVGGHEVWQLAPGGDQLVATARVGLDPRRGAQRDRHARARGANGAKRRRARLSPQCLLARLVIRMQVQRYGAGGNRCARLSCELTGRARRRRM